MMCTDSLNENTTSPSDPVSSAEEPSLSHANLILLQQEVYMLQQNVQMLLRERAIEQELLAREKAADQKRKKRARTPAIFLRGAGAALALIPVCFVSLQFLRRFLGYLLYHILKLSLETSLLYGGATLIGLLLLLCAAPLAELLCWKDDDDDCLTDIDLDE